jgi:transposase-like protein
MIEHSSEWLVLVPLSNRNNEKTTCAFLDRVLNRFGAPVEVLIDQDLEFYGEFQKL